MIKPIYPPRFDEQLQIDWAWLLLKLGDPICADNDRHQQNQIGFHAFDAMQHLQQHLHEPISRKYNYCKNQKKAYIIHSGGQDVNKKIALTQNSQQCLFGD